MQSSSENGFMEPTYYAFQRPISSFENMTGWWPGHNSYTITPQLCERNINSYHMGDEYIWNYMKIYHNLMFFPTGFHFFLGGKTRCVRRNEVVGEPPRRTCGRRVALPRYAGATRRGRYIPYSNPGPHPSGWVEEVVKVLEAKSHRVSMYPGNLL